MFIIRHYRTGFEAAHIINGHPKCGFKHGHSYKLKVSVLGDTSKWLDFAELKENTEMFVKELDHKDLGSITAEEISFKIAEHLTNVGYKGHLELWETDKFSVTLEIGNAIYEAKRGIKDFARYK